MLGKLLIDRLSDSCHDPAETATSVDDRREAMAGHDIADRLRRRFLRAGAMRANDDPADLLAQLDEVSAPKP